METPIQSSFIPHDAGKPQSTRRRGEGGITDLIFILAIIAVAASGALAGAVFLYQQYLQSTSASDLAQLQRAKAQFEPALIGQLTRLDDRMHAAEGILGSHIAPSAFFDALNEVTLKTVAYSSLDFQAADQNHIQIKMSGVARGVNSIALQADLLSKSAVFTNPIFSSIDRQKDGVRFSLTALVNPTALNFVQLVGGAPASAALPASQENIPSSPFGGGSSNQQSSSASSSPQ